MQVILTKDVDTLGDQGDVIQVSDGFARNYLFPKKVAIQATPGAMKDLNSRIERIRAKAKKKHEHDLGNQAKLEGLGEIVVEANTGETGKLFGTITPKELATIIGDKVSLTIDRKQISLNQSITRIGHYTVYVKLSAKVSASVQLSVLSTNPEVNALMGAGADVGKKKQAPKKEEAPAPEAEAAPEAIAETAETAEEADSDE